ncbi:MAG: endolytic transglycosylase MltG [Nitrospirae bacterium]|nr:endolytic transglycosylase MltG [Nitrospirota bacterium]
MLKKTYLVQTLVLIISVILLYFSTFFIPRDIQRPVDIKINAGMPFDQIVDLLKKKGLVKDGFLFEIVGRLTDADRRIKKGYYHFSETVSPYGILKKLIEGRVVEITVTIPEGLNLWQIAQRLDEAGILNKKRFLELAFDREFLDSLGIDGPSLEGYLFPDTYRFPLGIDAEDVIKTMVNNLRSHFTEEMKLTARKMGFSELEVLTLASIIEKEARVDEERPLISAVFHNRLKRGMPLQADPTTIYDLKGKRHIVTRQDISRKSPYNTYIIKGLPPGPIASPGIASIRAALYPADVPYLYFVYKGNGRHIFSTTEREHLQAVKRYRKINNMQRP